ncbi:response regulator transcription factor [Algoriphagus terrigena]|uniref:response regulator transcription factor n=1 Tax=Algoriphagus terrigena TaxID=344884 RepID=UPI00047EF156|nr:LuxR C-terminal-related transcriptional regulator [Algoriphagus terrigena]
MRSLAFHPQNYFRFQTLLLTVLGVFLTGGISIFLIEVNKSLQWTPSTICFICLVSIPYPISFAWIWLEYLRFKRRVDGLSQVPIRTNPTDKLQLLSTKEMKVLSLIKEKRSNKEICSELFIEHSTLKSHINHIYKKLGVKSRKETFHILDSTKTVATT